MSGTKNPSDDIAVNQMSDGTRRQKREYDDRHSRIMRIVSGLLELGCRPRVIELDGLYIELADPIAQVASTVTPVTSVAAPAMANAIHPDGSHTEEPVPLPEPLAKAASLDSYARLPLPPNVRSYRSLAKADLGRRLREMSGDGSAGL